MSPLYWRFRFGPLRYTRRVGAGRPRPRRSRETQIGWFIFLLGVLFLVALFASTVSH